MMMRMQRSVRFLFVLAAIALVAQVGWCEQVQPGAVLDEIQAAASKRIDREKPLRYSDGPDGAALRQALDPRRAPDFALAYAELKRSRNAPLMVGMAMVFIEYRLAFDKWPGDFEDEFLDLMEWQVAMHDRGLEFQGSSLGALQSAVSEEFLRGQVQANRFTGMRAQRATELANRFQAVSMRDSSKYLDFRRVKDGSSAYRAACAFCHDKGVMLAPRLGDRSAWDRHLRGKTIDMLMEFSKRGLHRDVPFGSDLTDLERSRALVYLANDAGMNFTEPRLPEGHSGLVTVLLPPDRKPAPKRPAFEEMSPADRAAAGEKLYMVFCAMCHSNAGTGVGSFPALTKSAILRDAPGSIDIVLKGRNAMFPFGSALSNDDVALLVNWISGAFTSGSALEVTPSHVRARR